MKAPGIELVNEHAARLTAGVTAAALLGAWVLQWQGLVALVAVGFLVRAGLGARYSLLARTSQAVAARLFGVRRVPAKPKRFAQAIGAAFTVGASGLFLASQPQVAWALAGVVVVCATLEAGLGFCLGCWMYVRLQRLGVLPADACPTCAEG